MEVKNKNTGLKVLVVILSILLLAAIGYILADKFILNKVKSSNNQGVKLTETEVKEIHDRYIINSDTDLYFNENVTLDNISEDKIISYAIYSYLKSNSIKVPESGMIYDCSANSDMNFNDDKIHLCTLTDDGPHKEISKSETMSISKNDIDKEIKKVFNTEKIYKAKNKVGYSGIFEDYYFTYSEEDNNFYLGYVMQGGLGAKSQSYFKILNHEQNNEELYVYDKAIRCIVSRCTNFWKADKGLNANAAYSDDITDKNIIKNNGNFDFEYIIEKYNDMFYTYKTTFKKASDGKYYWYSSEIVK